MKELMPSNDAARKMQGVEIVGATSMSPAGSVTRSGSSEKLRAVDDQGTCDVLS